MKIGAEDKKKLLVMIALLAIAIPLILYTTKGTFWGAESTTSASSASTVRPAAGAKPGSQDSDPNLRLDILEASRNVKYEAGGRNIFQKQEIKIEQPKVNPRTSQVEEAEAQYREWNGRMSWTGAAIYMPWARSAISC